MDYIATNSKRIKFTTWIHQWFKARLTFQEHILYCINSTIYGSIHKRKRFLKLHPYFRKAKALDTYFQHLFTVMHAPNKQQFLAYHLIRKLELLHDGDLIENLMSYAQHGFTSTVTAHLPVTFDPFNMPTSQIMTSYLNRFYARTKRDSLYTDLIAGSKRTDPNNTEPQLNTHVMEHTFSFLDFMPSPHLVDEILIAREYIVRCTTPYYRSYIHTLPEILTVMDLITLYAIDRTSESDHDRRIRRESKNSKAILRSTLSHLINASKDYHNVGLPITRPHQFQVPLHNSIGH